MKRIFCLVLLCAFFVSATAQDVYTSSGSKTGYRKKTPKKGYDPDKLIIGGGINLGYSGDYANFEISPKVGYKFNKVLSAGVGLGYQYYKSPFDPDYYPGKYIHDNIVYPALWAKANIWGPFFAATDFEYDIISEKGYNVNYDTYGNPYLVNDKITVSAPRLLVGPGYKYQVGGRVNLTFEIMYDVLQQQYSPYYQQLVYRAGIYVGL